MHLNKFDLNLLIALNALLQEKNVTRAAERVYVSQPAMSAALQKLRDYFRDPLLIRVGREMELSPRGLSLVAPVRDALLHVQATLGTQPSFDPATVERGFSLSIRDYIVPRLMPGVLRLLLAEAPKVHCVVEELAQVSLSRLEHGDIDLCIAIDNPALFNLRQFPDWLRTMELMSVRWVCVVCREHPYVREELTRELYQSMPHVMSRPRGASQAIPELLSRIGRTDLDVRVTSHSVTDLLFMLPGTQLIATVPESAALRFAASLQLRTFAPPWDIPDSRELLMWHKRNEADPGHAWLRNLFVEVSRQN
jgi:LysR family transcriptional regulator, nod-box dependent transcriptional activator